MIKRSAITEYLSRKLDDWRWLKKVDPRLIYDELVDLDTRPDFEFRPYHCQLVAFWIAQCLERFLFFYPMSSGKSKLALDIIRQKLKAEEIQRTLVLIPRKANIQSWIDEAKIHCPELRVVAVDGSTEQRRMAIAQEADVYVTTYGGLQYLMASKKSTKEGKGKYTLDQTLSKKVIKRIDMVIADEIHKCKNHESLIYRCVRKLSHEVQFAYGMTGTPGNEPVDLWAQFYVIDKGETFGETLGLFRAVFYIEKVNYWGRSEYTFDPDMEADFQRILQHRSLTYEESEVKELPAHRKLMEVLTWSTEQVTIYKDLEKGLINAHGNWEEMKGCYSKMRMLCSGYIDWKDPLTGAKESIMLQENPKLEWIENFLEDVTNDKVVFFYKYTTTGRLITELLKKLKRKHRWIYSGTKNPVKDYNDFRNDDDIQAMVINVQSGDAGLQFEMAKYAIIVESPESPIDRQQVLKRAWRDGARKTDITYLIDLVMVNSIEVDVVESAEAGKDFMDYLLNEQVEQPATKKIRRKS